MCMTHRPTHGRVQSYQTEYVPDVSNDLLKWKPASHNSVDFQLLLPDHPCASEAFSLGHLEPASDFPYLLGVLNRGSIALAYDLDKPDASSRRRPRSHAMANLQGVDLVETQRPAKIRFPEGEDPTPLVNIIVECNWDKEAGVWCFMRERSKCAPLPAQYCVGPLPVLPAGSAASCADVWPAARMRGKLHRCTASCGDGKPRER